MYLVSNLRSEEDNYDPVRQLKTAHASVSANSSTHNICQPQSVDTNNTREAQSCTCHAGEAVLEKLLWLGADA